MMGHKKLVNEQNEHMDEIAEIAVRLKMAAENINGEVKNQEGYILFPFSLIHTLD